LKAKKPISAAFKARKMVLKEMNAHFTQIKNLSGYLTGKTRIQNQMRLILKRVDKS
jgi:hypothetical protein